jgi:excisionase family DNA binding protein
MSMTIPDDKLCYRADDAARVMGIKRTTVYELIKSGALESRKLRGATVILRSELERFLSELPLAGPQARRDRVA